MAVKDSRTRMPAGVGRLHTVGRGLVALTMAVMAAPTAATAATPPVAALAGPQHASGFHAVDLGTLRGFCCSIAFAINDHGDIVGQSAVTGGENPAYHAVIWRHGHITDLGTLGGTTSNATAVNEHGDVAGYSDLPDGSTHAVLWRHGHMTDLGTLGGPSVATGITDTDEVVGFSVDATGTLVGFRWRHGTMTPILTPGGTFTTANAVNDRGQIAGALTDTLTVPARWQHGTGTPLDPRSGMGTAINAHGDVAGFFEGGTEQGFIWRPGHFTPLAGLPGATDTQALGINNRRDVVGFSMTATTQPVIWPRAGTPQALPGRSGGFDNFGIAWGVNNWGQVVGQSGTTGPAGTDYHAVLWTR